MFERFFRQEETEEHSREEYDNAEAAVKKDEKELEDFAMARSRFVPSGTKERRERLRALHDVGAAEAAELNRRHEELKANLERAKQELGDFEREKLGMHQQGALNTLEEAA